MGKGIDEYKLQIEKDLYTEVMIYIESQYNIEGVIDISKKHSNKIIFEDRKAAIQMVAKAIEEFSKENELDKNQVKDYLLSVIEEKIKLKDIFEEEFKEAKQIISTDYKEDER